MRAAEMFLAELVDGQLLDSVERVQVDLYGSLALTGKGHQTDIAVLMGLQGEQPDRIDPATIATKLETIKESGKLRLGGCREIPFQEETDLLFNRTTFLDDHPNGLRFRAWGPNLPATPLHDATYFSIGGGFVIRQGVDQASNVATMSQVPFPFPSAKRLLELTDQQKCSISELVKENEQVFRTEEEIFEGLQNIWVTMQACVDRGCQTEGILPGGLGVRRRAPQLLHVLKSREETSLRDPMSILDWVNLYALAVNEENAAGGRVVTAPTNGAAGIIPAVLHYFERFCPQASTEKIHRFLLTAAAIGSLYKKNASISGAEVGCQGEVGVACSMAAGALTEVLGGTPQQVEEAAEIGMEHNLGLTCDPIKGLVQIPCIERNAMGAVKAINASRIALNGDGKHFVSLDRVIRVMKRTGADMSSRYKETSEGGLAVNLSEC